MRNPSRKASFTMPAPKNFAITTSRNRPVMRLVKTAIETIPAERTTLSEAVGAF